MKLIKIDSDVFDISKRIKEIDKDYYIVYNLKTNKFEVHNSSQNLNSYALTCPYEKLDKRLLDYTMKTRICNSDKLLDEIDNHNRKIEKEIEEKRKDESGIIFKEIYKYANLSKNFDENKAYKNKWL